MKRVAFSCAVLFALVLLVGCSNESGLEPISDPGRTIVPRGSDAITLAFESADEDPSAGRGVTPDLKVRLPDEYLPSQSVTINLDLDDTEEQIIVFKRRDDSQDLIRLLVVTFDPIRNGWISAWEGVTSATSNRSFTVFAEDLTGDQTQELVAFGINNNGEQTLDVFRQTNSALGFGLSYTPILNITADVDIRIQRVARSEAYENAELINAPSFPVVSESRDPDSEQLFGTIQSTYFWDFPSRRYVLGPVEPIAGQVVEDDRLRNLFAGNEDTFERFLEGPWFRSSTGDDVMLAYFGPRDRSIVFHTGSLQQSFLWDVSTKTIYGRGMRITGINESIQTVQRLIYVSVLSLNQIEVTVQGTGNLGGVYERLSGGLQSAVLEDQDRVALSSITLNGLFRADSGREILFSGHEFRERDGGEQRTGGFALFQVGDDLVLSLKYIDENRLPAGELTYRAVYTESQDDERIVRTVALEPGALGVAGFTSNGDQPLSIEQIEIVEDQAGS